LLFDLYEKDEIDLFKRVCKPGDIVVDVGANIGLYTAIAGTLVGPSGRVFAVEPDAESYYFLKQTVDANELANARLLNAAASHASGFTLLYTSSQNRGDNRLYGSNMADGSVQVRQIRLDDYFARQGIESVDVVKMDVQGFEGHVIEGFRETLNRSPQLKMLMEFWPSGLRMAGTDPLALLRDVEKMGLQLFELKRRGGLVAVSDKQDLVDRYSGRKYANLVAFRVGFESHEARAMRRTRSMTEAA
jgi:FkbM family methyltransferase